MARDDVGRRYRGLFGNDIGRRCVHVAVKIDGKLLTGGSISLQSESHPVDFRRVELLDLEGCMDPKAKNFKSYFVKAANSRCKF